MQSNSTSSNIDKLKKELHEKYCDDRELKKENDLLKHENLGLKNTIDTLKIDLEKVNRELSQKIPLIDEFSKTNLEHRYKLAKESYKAQYAHYDNLRDKTYKYFYAFSFLILSINAINGIIKIPYSPCILTMSIFFICIGYLALMLALKPKIYACPQPDWDMIKAGLSTARYEDLYESLPKYYVDMAVKNAFLNNEISRYLNYGHFFGLLALAMVSSSMILNSVYFLDKATVEKYFINLLGKLCYTGFMAVNEVFCTVFTIIWNVILNSIYLLNSGILLIINFELSKYIMVITVILVILSSFKITIKINR